ncbi:MAG: GNAT family N-acetyltransferase [bacterium]|nr:GNAT family N-acetyltransferase [bacterium]
MELDREVSPVPVDASRFQVEFRPAETGDIKAIVSLCRELNEHDGTPFHEARHRPAIAELIAHPEWGRIFLIETGDEVAGYAVLALGFSLEFGGRDAFLDELFVRAPFRKRGIGAEAIDYISKVAQSLGVRALHLEVARANISAQEFYRKHGFRDHSRYLMTKWL